MRIRAFAALRPRDDLADRVAAVPYDVVDTAEAAALAAGNPYSLLHVSRPEIDLPAGTDLHADAVYAQGVETFRRFQAEGILVREKRPSLYLYRQVMGDHAQRGVVACCSIDEYQRNLIRKHEKTRKDKEDDRTRHTRELGANTGPVFLAYRDREDIDRAAAEVEAQHALYDFTAPDGIRHTVWRIVDAEPVARAFERVPVAYIADGHHRAAAAVRAGLERRAANPAHTGEEEYNWFLAVLFPARQLQILPYNRCVHDLNGLTSERFLGEVAARFSLRENAEAKPREARTVSLYMTGKWYGLSWKTDAAAAGVDALDVSVLQNRLLAPVLGIDDPRTSKRIDFVGGIRGTAELVRLVDSGRAAVAFSMYPTMPAESCPRRARGSSRSSAPAC